MTSCTLKLNGVLLVSTMALVACGGTPDVQTPAEADQVPALQDDPAIVDTVTEREVLRPDLYADTAMAIWDGRPSIGGIWVANPNVNQAERVRIRNTATGVTTTGALFAREASIPGPPFLMSGEAATLLGAEPGVPVQLEVTAVRREIVTTVGGATALATLPADPDTTPAILQQATPLPEQQSTPAPAPAEPPAETASQPVAVAAQAIPTASTLRGPYVQVGAFSVPANATRLVERLERMGYTARTVEQQGRTRILTRVLVGPAQTQAEHNELMSQLRSDGFSDILAASL